jgi:hypothetical protein
VLGILRVCYVSWLHQLVQLYIVYTINDVKFRQTQLVLRTITFIDLYYHLGNMFGQNAIFRPIQPHIKVLAYYYATWIINRVRDPFALQF